MRSQSGQATIEFTAMLVWLAIAALFAWQIGLAAWAYVSATNAARTDPGEVERSCRRSRRLEHPAGHLLAPSRPSCSRNASRWIETPSSTQPAESSMRSEPRAMSGSPIAVIGSAAGSNKARSSG